MTFSTFRKQVDEHEDEIYRYARSILKDGVTAQDVTQDVLVTLWEHREEIDPDRLKPWLLRVTRNACIDKLRRRQTRRKTMTVDTEDVTNSPCNAPSPESNAAAADVREHVHAALDRISEPYRQVVELRELQQLKYKEIAEALDMPLNTVKVYIHRGRKKLRQQLSDRLDPVPA